jgi:hypothetical protein
MNLEIGHRLPYIAEVNASVMPGPAEGRNPESILTVRGYAFRARGPCAAPRNDCF